MTTLAADLAERAENATVASPAAEPAEQPADVTELDGGADARRTTPTASLLP